MQPTIARHKTALIRSDISRPVRIALSDGLLNENTPLFDYGCGQGGDLQRLKAMDIPAFGWDPVHAPGGPLIKAPVVNLGYVVNVIEDLVERQETLQKAWSLTQKLLIVSARLTTELKALGEAEEFADGCLTSLGTFQKFYEQHELKTWIEQSLEATALPAAPGVFYVFRDEEARFTFQSSRYRKRIAVPRRSRSVELYNQHESLLEPLISFVTEYGRLPEDDELENTPALVDVFGTIKRAFRTVKLATSKEQWEEIATERAQELLIYLALSQFDGRPKYSKLPLHLQRDVRSFFSHYSKACKQADDLLFSIGKIEHINLACLNSSLGKTLPTALYIHESALDQLTPTLRLYEGCARGLIGRVDGANLIKLDRTEPKISYLCYPNFDTDPHPALSLSVTVHLQTFRVKYRSYKHHKNPPILHRKETLLASDHPLYNKFARLTRIEESKELYEDTSRIGTRDGWNEVLKAKGYYLHGHRLLQQK